MLGSVAVILVVTGALFWHFVGLGDPGHHLARSLKAQEEAVLPPDARVFKVIVRDSRWDPAGCEGHYGWTAPTVTIQFGSRESASDLVAHADRVLRADGWGPMSDPRAYFRFWSKPPGGPTTLALSQIPRATVRDWEVSAMTAPDGREAQEC